MDDDIIRMAREAGLSHFYDSEGDFSGVTDALLVDADKQRNDKRLVEILGPLVALIRADEREACVVAGGAAADAGLDVAAAIRARAQQPDAAIADRLARHGIQACLYPQCVGGQSGTVCHKHCPTPCPDCRGLGYDASGQLCGCQGNPSF